MGKIRVSYENDKEEIQNEEFSTFGELELWASIKKAVIECSIIVSAGGVNVD